MQLFFLIILIVLIYICVIVITLYSIGLLHLVLIKIKVKNPTQPQYKSNNDWPKVTVQVPIYNEYNVAKEAVYWMTTLDYPKEKLQIQVIDDSTDDTYPMLTEVVRDLKIKGFDIDLLHREHREGFKGGALRDAHKDVSGEFIAIFDADFRPYKDFIKRCLHYFDDEKVGCIQGKWDYIDGWKSWFNVAQLLSMDVFFVEEQEARNIAGYYLRFNGSGGMWRKSTIDDAGGWSGETLSEDLDLAYRAQMKNWQFKYDRFIETPSEIPETLDDFKKQQYRWTFGKMQVLKKIMPEVMKTKLPFLKKYHVYVDLFNFLTSIAVTVMSILSVPALFLMLKKPEMTIFWKFLAVGAIYTPIILYMIASAIKFHKKTMLATVGAFAKNFLPFSILYSGITWHTCIAVIDNLFGKKIEFIRTPKFLSSEQRKVKYSNSKITHHTVLELVFGLYFCFALYMDYLLHSISFILLHFSFSVSLLSMAFITIRQKIFVKK